MAATALAAALALSAGAVQAAQITGGIGFGGAWIPVGGGGVATATGADIVGDQAVVVTSSGDFAGIGFGTLATYNDFNFTNTPVPGLWSVGGFTFDLANLSLDSQDATGVVLSGSGTVTGGGFDPTAATWSFSGDETSGTFAFSSTTTAVPVVEPASLGLLGLGLIGLGVMLRRRRQATA